MFVGFTDLHEFALDQENVICGKFIRAGRSLGFAAQQEVTAASFTEQTGIQNKNKQTNKK